jgi:hypothetical protein
MPPLKVALPIVFARHSCVSMSSAIADSEVPKPSSTSSYQLVQHVKSPTCAVIILQAALYLALDEHMRSEERRTAIMKKAQLVWRQPSL